MKDISEQACISSVKWWIEKTIIGHNFCPFAKKEFIDNSIHYQVVMDSDKQQQLMVLTDELTRLKENPSISTTLIILTNGLESFFDYLDFLELANLLLADLGYEGTFQLASFHPDYCFADVTQDAASNYTNRSPMPIIHILREQKVEKVLASYPNPESIPDNNIEKAEQLGAKVFQQILQDSMKQIDIGKA